MNQLFVRGVILVLAISTTECFALRGRRVFQGPRMRRQMSNIGARSNSSCPNCVGGDESPRPPASCGGQANVPAVFDQLISDIDAGKFAPRADMGGVINPKLIGSRDGSATFLDGTDERGLFVARNGELLVSSGSRNSRASEEVAAALFHQYVIGEYKGRRNEGNWRFSSGRNHLAERMIGFFSQFGCNDPRFDIRSVVGGWLAKRKPATPAVADTPSAQPVADKPASQPVADSPTSPPPRSTAAQPSTHAVDDKTAEVTPEKKTPETPSTARPVATEAKPDLFKRWSEEFDSDKSRIPTWEEFGQKTVNEINVEDANKVKHQVKALALDQKCVLPKPADNKENPVIDAKIILFTEKDSSGKEERRIFMGAAQAVANMDTQAMYNFAYQNASILAKAGNDNFYSVKIPAVPEKHYKGGSVQLKVTDQDKRVLIRQIAAYDNAPTVTYQCK